MSSIITSAFRLLQAQTFIDSFTSELSTSNLYLGISKPTFWRDKDNNIVEHTPETPNESTKGNKADWDEMIAMKKVISAHVRSVIPRYDWYAGEYYTPWDDNDPDIWTKQFYVMTDAYCIYKCIDVPIDNTGNQLPSTICPTNTQVNNGMPFKTQDGYKWKFMGRVENIDVPYLSSSWIPVKYITDADYDEARTTFVQNDIQQSAIDGTVDRIYINWANSTYTNDIKTFPEVPSDGGVDGDGYLTAVEVTINGDGVGATAKAFGFTENGKTYVKGFDMISSGSGYTWAEVEVKGIIANGASFVCVISPSGGHGSNIVSELGAFYNMISVNFDQSEDGDVTVENDYRKLILIANPTNRAGIRLNEPIYDLRTQYRYTALSSSAGLSDWYDYAFQEAKEEGDPIQYTATLIDSTADANGSGTVTFVNTSYNDVPTLGTSKMYAYDSGGTRLDNPNFVISNVEKDPYGVHYADGSKERNNSIRKYSGEILYKDYRRVISRSNDQSEQINIIFEF